jgi:hypothetical protein
MKKAALLSLTLILTAVVAALWCSRRQHELAAAFDDLKIGTSRAQLQTKLGDPWKATSCGKVFGGDTPRGCVIEVLYASPTARVLPEYWAFRYDSSGTLIDKYHYVSP